MVNLSKFIPNAYKLVKSNPTNNLPEITPKEPTVFVPIKDIRRSTLSSLSFVEDYLDEGKKVMYWIEVPLNMFKNFIQSNTIFVNNYRDTSLNINATDYVSASIFSKMVVYLPKGSDILIQIEGNFYEFTLCDSCPCNTQNKECKQTPMECYQSAIAKLLETTRNRHIQLSEKFWKEFFTN